MNSAYNVAALPNLENMSQIQQKEISVPAAFAMRNADEDDKRLEDRLKRVNESEESDELKLNPDERREQQRQQKKKKKEEQRKNRGLENGRFVDFSA